MSFADDLRETADKVKYLNSDEYKKPKIIEAMKRFPYIFAERIAKESLQYAKYRSEKKGLHFFRDVFYIDEHSSGFYLLSQFKYKYKGEDYKKSYIRLNFPDKKSAKNDYKNFLINPQEYDYGWCNREDKYECWNGEVREPNLCFIECITDLVFVEEVCNYYKQILSEKGFSNVKCNPFEIETFLKIFYKKYKTGDTYKELKKPIKVKSQYAFDIEFSW